MSDSTDQRQRGLQIKDSGAAKPTVAYLVAPRTRVEKAVGLRFGVSAKPPTPTTNSSDSEDK